MKQTVEEAAMQELMLSYAIVVEGEFAYQRQAMLNMFKKGADWQKEQAIEALSSKMVEEAAMNFANYESNILDKLPFKVKNVVDYDNGLTRGFKAGAEWQAKQSPWISVKERMPGKDGYYFVTDGDIVEKVYFYKVWNKFASTKEYPHLFFNEGVIKAWLFIPSFDEILEANKDVLERIKEKGD